MADMSWRSLARTGIVGLAVAVSAWVGGGLVQRAVLGADEAEMRERVQGVVREELASIATGLRNVALEVADPGAIRAASSGDATGARRLLSTTARAAAQNAPAESGLTIYGREHEPIAWAGRPSDLIAERLQGDEAWFLAPGPLGLRVVYVHPVVVDGVRAGTVVVERPLVIRAQDTARAAGLQEPDTESFRFPTWMGTVSIQLPFEGVREGVDATAFEVTDPLGRRLFTATLEAGDLRATRGQWRSVFRSIALVIVVCTLLLLAGPLMDWRNRTRGVARYTLACLLVAACVVGARLVLLMASPPGSSGALMFSSTAYASPLLNPLFSSPFDFAATSATVLALAGLLLFAVEAWRLRIRATRMTLTARRVAPFVIVQTLAGSIVAVVLFGHVSLIADTISRTSLDLLHFSLHPWESSRLTLQVGLLMAHTAAIVLAVLALRAAIHAWRIPRHDWRPWALSAACWILPLVVWQTTIARSTGGLSLVAPVFVAAAFAVGLTRLVVRYRHGSQALRLGLLTLPVLVPAFAFYPAVVGLERAAKEAFVEARYAPQVRNLRQNVQIQLQDSLARIDSFPGLVDLVTADVGPNAEVLTDRAFQVWQRTALATYPITSSVELYGSDGTLVSRFAFNLPEDLSNTPRSEERSCDWDVFEEVVPFFAAERRVLHAGRAFCSADPGAPPSGSIVVHAMPDDYQNLAFIAARTPYVDLLLPADPMRGEGQFGRDVEFAVYGWSRTPLYAVERTAWSLPDDVFDRVVASRDEMWTELARGQELYDVYLLNDRGGIYALGFPVLSGFGHLVNLAELTVLALTVYVLLLAVNPLFRWLGQRDISARALLRELRASFYRKLFLAFVAAVFVPVIALVLVTRTYMATQMEAGIEQEALRTASVAGRVVEDLAAPRAAQQGLGVDDNLMVWVSRLIDQDVNLFVGDRLAATSERNLFASGLLPTRLDAGVYQALTLELEAAVVTRERIGGFEYLVAATPLSLNRPGILTVPLTSRQREIDRQIDILDRRALLAALLFIVAGAGLGYSMAERISDPVNRLTRATRRIARGDLDARIAATSSDELKRLVEAFNSMAAELQRQRTVLERTHRLEAWAEMARQVAHEIKNPLTPIQLNAEHLGRVHVDRGEPLGPVLRECVATILTQVKLLRQIASEFSSFASSPTARPSEIDIAAVLSEVIAPYRAGLEGRVTLDLRVPATLPPVFADRTLVSRSLVNIVENALHAMPGVGRLGVTAQAEDGRVRIRVSDTGGGMDEESLTRAFEPYFSTKATGTGLGLPIAKRNIELSGGTIAVHSVRDGGTTVEITLPVAGESR
jgi:signal transduction histidine kinase